MDGESLSITGTRTHEAPEGWRPLRRELQEGDYRLNLRLNVAIKEAKIRAHVENGVLDLMLPKADEVKPRKIQVTEAQAVWIQGRLKRAALFCVRHLMLVVSVFLLSC